MCAAACKHVRVPVCVCTRYVFVFFLLLFMIFFSCCYYFSFFLLFLAYFLQCVLSRVFVRINVIGKVPRTLPLHSSHTMNIARTQPNSHVRLHAHTPTHTRPHALTMRTCRHALQHTRVKYKKQTCARPYSNTTQTFQALEKERKKKHTISVRL